MVICSLAYKPLVLLYLLEMFDFKRTLCFTSSVESTHRCAALGVIMIAGVMWTSLTDAFDLVRTPGCTCCSR